ncbi:MAG TPA: zinc-binding dehydrogenase [Acidimicrobiales bacterium]|nr:zinc-binding dehydrogenase [Acidimicrobiales bacterium]
MRAAQVVRHGRPVEAVEIRDVDVPEPGPGAVRIAVSAASLNFGDVARCRGTISSVMIPPPFTLGMDVCGVVDAAGDGATQWLGRRVVAITAMALGGIAESALAQVHGVFAAPAELDDAEAAAFTLPFHVSHLALHKRARIAAGETLLVVGGASGVGTAAIQLGVAAGLDVIAVAGSGKASVCEQLGASLVIDPATGDMFDRVMSHTDDRGADVVFDVVGGDLVETTWTCVAREGRYLPVGFNDDLQSGLTGRPLRKVSTGNFSVVGVLLSYSEVPLQVRRAGLNPFPSSTGDEVHAALCDLVTQAGIRPVVSRRIRMEDVGAALEDHEQRRTTGRTVVDVHT